eukprot:225178-Chlamydomonas_euryale.AAC.1
MLTLWSHVDTLVTHVDTLVMCALLHHQPYHEPFLPRLARCHPKARHTGGHWDSCVGHTPLPLPLPLPVAVPLPVPVRAPASVPLPVPMPAPMPIPMPVPLPVPMPVPVPVPVPAPMPVPVPAPLCPYLFPSLFPCLCPSLCSTEFPCAHMCQHRRRWWCTPTLQECRQTPADCANNKHTNKESEIEQSRSKSNSANCASPSRRVPSRRLRRYRPAGQLVVSTKQAVDPH